MAERKTEDDTSAEQVSKELSLSGKNRFVPMEERRDTSVLPVDVIKNIWDGKCLTLWRGVPIVKDPLSLTVNQQLLWEVKPQTVIEFGAYKGGSALWTADMLKMFGCKSRVISIDIDLSLLDPLARESPDVEFIEGDLFQVEKCFPADFLKNLPHPWFVMEDAHVNMVKVLEYFDAFTKPGDYICVEDTNASIPFDTKQGFTDMPGFTETGSAKLNALKEFLTGRSQKYLVDQRYTDFFGYNATWNMNGYLKRF